MRIDRSFGWLAAAAAYVVAFHFSVVAAHARGNDLRDYVTTYGDQFKEFYPSIAKTRPVIPPHVPLEEEISIWAIPEKNGRKATLVQSDSSKVPYEEEVAVITIEPPDGSKQFIQAKGFRTLDMKWINDRLLYIYCDIGHTAGVEAIFDADRGKWVYQQSIGWTLKLE